MVKQLENPFDGAGYISKYSAFWLTSFVKKNYNRTIDLEDVYKIPHEDASKDLGEKLKKVWDKELLDSRSAKKKPSFIWAIIRMFWSDYIRACFWVSLSDWIFRPLQGIVLGWIIRDSNHYFSLKPNANAKLLDEIYWKVFYDGLILIVVSSLLIFTNHPYHFIAQHIGMKVRVACCHLIYRHALKLDQAAIGQTTVGQMVNLLTNDVNRFDYSVFFISYLLTAPINALICILVLSFYFLGAYATIAGSTVLLLYLPLQSVMGRWSSKLRYLTASRTDERIRLMNEIIPAMRVIKLYTWEEPFAKLVELARANEVRLIKYASVLRSINMALFFVSSKIILFICFITYVLLGYHLSAEVVFVPMTLFNGVRLLMTLFFSYGVAQVAETSISCNRLQEFLLLPEQKLSSTLEKSSSENDIKPEDVKIVCSDASANWTIVNKTSSIQKEVDDLVSTDQFEVYPKKAPGNTLTSSQNSLFVSTTNVHLDANLQEGRTNTEQNAITALRDITYTLTSGELMIVVGRVGSGKSSVLMSILGELPLSTGKISIKGRISYAAQSAWIFAGTVEENVLFGSPMDRVRYNQVLKVCALDRDLKLFPKGDESLVGERGVSLSGGQRARINLARAIYHDADIYLLDDPLSAVDTLVAKHIFNECIRGFLKDKAVMLATHQTQFIDKESIVLYLDGGRQISCKNYSDNKDLQMFIGSSWDKSDSESGMRIRRISNMEIPRVNPSDREARAKDDIRKALLESSSDSSDEDDIANAKLGEKPILQAVESNSHESVGLAIYWHYIKASGSIPLIFALALTNLGTQAIFSGTDFWLTYWTDTEQRRVDNGGTGNYEPVTLTDTLTRSQNAMVYTILIVSLFTLTLLRTTCFFIACMKSSINLHKKLFRSILKAPIKFFDYNPIGMLLNRVSRDMGIVDDVLPATAFDTIEIFINVIGILVTVSIVYPVNLIPALILFAVVLTIRMLYVSIVRDIKMIEGATRSPVFSHLATSLDGLTTIRAFKVEEQFEKRFDDYQDTHSSAWFLFLACSRWLGNSLDYISLAYIAVITIVSTLALDSITGSKLGLAISSALVLSGSFQWGVRQSTEMESNMTSVVRIKEYSELPEEPPHESEPHLKPPPEWPQAGAIQFNKVSLYYQENDPPVLKELTFSINAGERIGIVGRTGAGKSSIITVLFRLTEPTGSIVIDDIDTKSIGLHDLRKKLSIIPQEPTLFNGSIRHNLDPFRESSDLELWRALEQVKLAELVRSLPGQLEAEVSEGGGNMSVGERQLICLARAVLRQNSIIVLDEATANVDPDTDKFIQRTINESFANRTRITIAHRLHTIMDSDRVLVMEGGQLKEFDAPFVLLQNESGFFSCMVKNTGKHSAHLRKVARNCYEKKYGKSKSTKG